VDLDLQAVTGEGVDKTLVGEERLLLRADHATHSRKTLTG
jgi:hypothetical protein